MNLTINKNNFNRMAYHTVSVFQNQIGTEYILIGQNKHKTNNGILKIKVTQNSPTEQINMRDIIGDPQIDLTCKQVEEFLHQNKNLVEIYKTYGIVGFIRFLVGYYLIVITKKSVIGKIGSHKIFKIEQVQYIQLFNKNSMKISKKQTQLEERYYKLFVAFNLSTGFYYSISYDLTNSLSTNMCRNIHQQKTKATQSEFQSQFKIEKDTWDLYDNQYIWNWYLMKEFKETLGSKHHNWILPQIHGYIEQEKCQQDGRIYSFTLISRRSRHHAGTRYLKRGMNSLGFVANHVETEQILVDITKSAYAFPVCASFVQLRGSIPLYWFQVGHVLQPKPAIQTHCSDPYYHATEKHLSSLIDKYGANIFLINLVKRGEKFKRENNLAEEYKKAIEFVINQNNYAGINIIYHHFDMKSMIRQDKAQFFERTMQIGLFSILQMGVFSVCSDTLGSNYRQLVEFQNGTIRSNCVDCLDRTNFFQQIMAETALAVQFARLNSTRFKEFLDPSSSILLKLRSMFECMGNALSLQYGGSVAHQQKGGQDNNNLQPQNKVTQQFEFLTSIQRHYNNSFTDQDKQHTIDLFLGQFIPTNTDPDTVQIWDQQNTIVYFPEVEENNVNINDHSFQTAYNNFQHKLEQVTSHFQNCCFSCVSPKKLEKEILSTNNNLNLNDLHYQNSQDFLNSANSPIAANQTNQNQFFQCRGQLQQKPLKYTIDLAQYAQNDLLENAQQNRERRKCENDCDNSDPITTMFHRKQKSSLYFLARKLKKQHNKIEYTKFPSKTGGGGELNQNINANLSLETPTDSLNKEGGDQNKPAQIVTQPDPEEELFKRYLNNDMSNAMSDQKDFVEMDLQLLSDSSEDMQFSKYLDLNSYFVGDGGELLGGNSASAQRKRDDHYCDNTQFYSMKKKRKNRKLQYNKQHNNIQQDLNLLNVDNNGNINFSQAHTDSNQQVDININGKGGDDKNNNNSQLLQQNLQQQALSQQPPNINTQFVKQSINQISNEPQMLSYQQTLQSQVQEDSYDVKILKALMKQKLGSSQRTKINKI